MKDSPCARSYGAYKRKISLIITWALPAKSESPLNVIEKYWEADSVKVIYRVFPSLYFKYLAFFRTFLLDSTVFQLVTLNSPSLLVAIEVSHITIFSWWILKVLLIILSSFWVNFNKLSTVIKGNEVLKAVMSNFAFIRILSKIA